MNFIKEPLIFAPVYKKYLWGGSRIAKHFKRANTPDICAESWEISAHPDGMSIVAEGSFKRSTLDELVKRFGTDLIGTLAPQYDRFPLLFKIIDARCKLSVQVHPNNGNASLTGGEPKTEMWYVLGCEEGASLYAGMVATATSQSVAEAIKNGTVAKQLAKLKVKPDEALFIPGGLVHAIGDGCLVYEVQQNSNTTYRMFDWNRTDPEGKPRQLHVEESLATIDWSLKPPTMLPSEQKRETTGASWSKVVSCEFFTIQKFNLNGTVEIKQDGSTFTSIFVVSGSAIITSNGRSVELAKGSSALIPAAAKSYTIETTVPATMLITTL
ncbi:MAG: mannose-6-phosphate isomerase [Kiritimatiellae bacterium]|jgi:mannose-6-phosphate isomerase|nr:mannose-6-phosphate isomerase [Kiritimatiellia bacterium]